MEIFGYNINKATSKQKVKQAPQGLIGIRTSSGYITEEFLRDLQWPQAGKVYQEMASNDAIIGACLYLIETSIRRANWHVQEASTESGDIEAKEFLESCMFDMQDQSWDDFICDALSMLTYGFSFHEVIYKVRRGPLEKDPKFKSNYTDGRFGWQELPIRSQASLDQWAYDENTGKITEFIQDPSLVGVKGTVQNIPIEGNLLLKTRANRGNPEGWSLLRRAYRSWYFKRYIEELEGIGIERNLAGIPHLQPPEDVELFDKENEEMVKLLEWAQQLVNDLRQDRQHGVITPGGWSLKLIGSEGGSKGLDTDKIIRRHESRMAMSMLSDLVLLGGDRTGSFALAETKQGLFLDSIEALISSITSAFNTKLVPTLFAINNWQLEKLPQIVATDLKAPSLKEVALILRSFKVDITKNQKLFNYLMSLIQAPSMTEEEFNQLMSDVEGSETEPVDPELDPAFQDTAANDFKQSDESYA